MRVDRIATTVFIILAGVAPAVSPGQVGLAGEVGPPARRHLVQTTIPPRFGELCFTSVRDNMFWDISLKDVATGAVRLVVRRAESIMASDWTHDGSRLAFLTYRDNNLEVFTMAADGSDWRRITTTPGYDYGPEWSPDGRHLAYAEDVGGGRMHIFVVNPDGSNRVQLTSGAAGGYGPIWSPDGTRITYISGTQVMVMHSDGSHPVRLYSDTAELQSSDWSPTGSHILFMSKRTGIFKLHTIRLADGVVEPVPTGDYDAWAGRWSPDGSLMSFYSYGIGSVGFPNGRFAVFLMNPDGSDLRQVTALTPTDRSWHPTWRP